MTLLDLGRLIKRYWWLVVGLPIVCVVVCALVVLPHSGAASSTTGSNASSSAGSAVAYIVPNSQAQAVAGLAASEARQAQVDNPGVTATVKSETASTAVTITVDGTDPILNAQVANEIADNVVAVADEFYADTQNKEGMIAFKAQIEYAEVGGSVAGSGSSGGGMKYLLVALLAGLFVAICIVVVIDMVRRPVKSIEGVQDAVELPVLEKLPVADGGERLLANVRFASKKDQLGSVCVIPTSIDVSAQEAASALEAAAAAEGVSLEVVRCQSFAHGMGAAYAAQNADAVVLTVNQWSDSLKTLESAVAELQLADTNLVGLAFGKESKSN